MVQEENWVNKEKQGPLNKGALLESKIQRTQSFDVQG